MNWPSRSLDANLIENISTLMEFQIGKLEKTNHFLAERIWLSSLCWKIRQKFPRWMATYYQRLCWITSTKDMVKRSIIRKQKKIIYRTTVLFILDHLFLTYCSMLCCVSPRVCYVSSRRSPWDTPLFETSPKRKKGIQVRLPDKLN